MSKTKKEDKTKPDRITLISRLANAFDKDYEIAIAEFPKDKKVEFIEHIIGCMDLIEVYLFNPTDENYKVYSEKENTFLKKHGKRLKMYSQKNMFRYYGDPIVLAEKGVYTTEQWNELSGDEQRFSKEEFSGFFKFCKNLLYHERRYLLLEQTPEDEKEENDSSGKLNGTAAKQSQKGKLKREFADKMTCLSQEQTTLLIHYLKQDRVFLNDEYLNNMDAAKAFEILTGYSTNTIRATLGKINHYQNKGNLTEIHNMLNRVKIAVEKDLKVKK